MKRRPDTDRRRRACTVLLGIVLIAAPLASYVPLATLSAIVMVVAINMGDWHEFLELRRYSYNYRIILLATFFVTVLRPDHCRRTGHGAGEPVLHLPHVGADPHRPPAADRRGGARTPLPLSGREHARHRLGHLYGSLFFGAVNKLEELLDPGTPATWKW